MAGTDPDRQTVEYGDITVPPTWHEAGPSIIAIDGPVLSCGEVAKPASELLAQLARQVKGFVAVDIDYHRAQLQRFAVEVGDRTAGRHAQRPTALADRQARHLALGVGDRALRAAEKRSAGVAWQKSTVTTSPVALSNS